MLEHIKLLLGITSTDKDELLYLLIDNAREEALAFTHRDTADELDTAIIQMVVYNYNRLGTEGVDKETYSGVSFDYSATYPESIIKFLKSKRKVIMV